MTPTSNQPYASIDGDGDRPFNNLSAGICDLRNGHFPRPSSAVLPMGVLGTQHDPRNVTECVMHRSQRR